MKKNATETANTNQCTDNCGERTIACKLTSPEMQKRKTTVIASLKKQILEKKGLKDGYAYKFKGTDSVVGKSSQIDPLIPVSCPEIALQQTIQHDRKKV